MTDLTDGVTDYFTVPYIQEKILDSLSGAIVTLELHGTVFFLSSTVVLGKIMSHLHLPHLNEQAQQSTGTGTGAGAGAGGSSEVELSPLLGQTKRRNYASDSDPEGGGGGGGGAAEKMAVKYLILDCERLQVCTLA